MWTKQIRTEYRYVCCFIHIVRVNFCCFTERKCTDLFALNLAFLWKLKMFVCHLLHLGMWDHFPAYPNIPINQVDGSKWIHMFHIDFTPDGPPTTFPRTQILHTKNSY